MNADTLLHQALEHQRAGRLAEAEALCRRIVEASPSHAGAWYRLGLVAETQSHLPDAVDCYQRALRLLPGTAEIHHNLGSALQKQGKWDAAIEHYQRALALAPELAETLSNLGCLLMDRGQLEPAAAKLRRAIELRPGMASAHNNLGIVLLQQCKLDEALARYRSAMRLAPDWPVPHGNLLLALHSADHLPPLEVFAEHRRWAERHADPLTRAANTVSLRADGMPREPPKIVPMPGRRLRVGYVSADFRTHSVAFFIEPLLAAHDRAVVEIHAYSDVSRPDATTERIARLVEHWHDVRPLSDAELAAKVRADRIDILVDLAGHTAGNRLLAFARRPAPLQVTYLGYPATTGMAAMDFRLTDAWADPIGMTEALHTEELVRLPGGFLCYRPPEDAPAVETRSEERGVTFGCFNNLSKMSPTAVGLFAAVLRAVPSARLILKSAPLADPPLREEVEGRFAAQGIDPARLELCGRVGPLVEHLALYRRVDVALDSLPYNGTTTTCEALWMGAPVVTLAGSAHAGRVGASLLSAVGLPELVAATPDAYVAIAERLAGDRAYRETLRSELRRRLADSPLTRPARLARAIEAAYQTMWARLDPPAPAAATPTPKAPAPRSFDAEAEALRRDIERTVSQFQKAPSAERTELLRAIRRQLAQVWMQILPANLKASLAGPLGACHRLLRTSGLLALPLSDEDRRLFELLRPLVARGWSHPHSLHVVLAASLFARASELALPGPTSAVPDWFQPELLRILDETALP